MQNMSFAYLQRRPELVNTALSYAQQLLMKDEVAHDAILLMDRTMSTSLQVPCWPCLPEHVLPVLVCKPLLCCMQHAALLWAC